MNKLKTFLSNTGEYVMLDQVSQFSYHTQSKGILVKLSLNDGTWVYVDKDDFDAHIAPHLEVIYESSSGTAKSSHLVPRHRP